MRWIVAIVFLVHCEALRADESPYLFMKSTADTIATAMSKLRTGEMDIEYVAKATGFDERTQLQLVDITQLTAHVIWREDLRYASYALQESHTDRDGKPGSKMIQAGWNGPGEMIRTPEMFCRTVQDRLWCEYKTTGPQTFPHATYYDAMNPKMNWFSSSLTGHKNGQHVTHLTLHETDNPVQRTTVSPVASHPRRMRIVRNYALSDFQTGFFVDLDQGGLITESWIHHPQQDWFKYSWDWKQDAYGVWFVSKWTHTQFKGDDIDTVIYQVDCVVKNFNSQPTIPANRFEFSSLKLAKGTRIEKTTEKGKTISYVGGKPPAKTKFDLDTLIEDAQSGFAAPPRKTP